MNKHRPLSSFSLSALELVSYKIEDDHALAINTFNLFGPGRFPVQYSVSSQGEIIALHVVRNT